MATKEQIAANRKNAQKSTGPRTPSGKARTRLNGLKHGLRSNEVVLPTESAAAFQEHLDLWMADWQPTTMARAQLVEDAAVAAWRKKRCVRVESARISKRVRASYTRWDRDQRARLDAIVERLEDDPREAVEALLETRAGVARLGLMWEQIAEAAADPEAWHELDEHHFRLFHLMGRQPGDGPRELFVISWRLTLFNVEIENDESGLEPFDDDEAAAAAAMIRRFATEKAASMREFWLSLPDDAPARDAQAELDAFAPKPEDAPLLRYEAHLCRQFQRSLADLTKLSRTGDDLVELPDEPAAPNEANLSPEVKASTQVEPESPEAEPAPEPAETEAPEPAGAILEAPGGVDGHAEPLAGDAAGVQTAATPRSDR